MRSLTLLLLALLVTGCALSDPISKNITAGSKSEISGRLESGLQDAHYNLDNAIKVGALEANDPGFGCLDDVLRKLGLLTTQEPPPSFAPRVESLMGKASVLYIRGRQLQKLQGGGIVAPATCQQFIGMLIIDLASDSAGAFPGGGVVPRLR